MSERTDTPAMPRNMRFANAAPGAVDLLVYGDIGEWGDVSAAGFARALKEHEGSRVRVCINSYGGEVFAGHAIYSQLRRHKGGVDTVVDGIAASAASIVAMAGDKIAMGKGTMMMVHNPWTVAIGEADDMRKTADVLDRVRDNLIAIYEERTGIPREQLQQLLANETWMTAEQAVELGFAHEVTASVSASIRNHGTHFLANGIFIPLAMGTDNKDSKMPQKPETEKPTPASETPEEVKAKAVVAERERGKAIRNASKSLGLPDDFAEQHIADGTSVAAFHAAAINKRADMEKEKPRPRDTARPAITAGDDERDKWIRGNSHWLIQRAGHRVVETVENASKKRGDNERIDAGEFRGQSMFDIARECLERAGVRTRGMTRTEIAGHAMMNSGGYNTTSDFAVLLENTLHKVLLASYEITDDTWSLFCATGSVSDFRPHPRYKTGFLGRLRKVNEHGELTREQIPDGEKESISADTKGYIIGYTREMIINDDMGWLNRLAMNLGRSARLSIESDVYDTLALNGGLGPDMNDGNPLFDASHDNIGSSSALTVSGIEADRVLMGRQKDPAEKEFLVLRPRVLLVPDSLGAQARVVNDAQFDTDAVDPGTNEANKYQKPNVVRGLFTTIVDTPRITGNRRYLFADPTANAALEVAFLDGQQQPQIESKDGWSMLGVEWRIYIDYGVAGIDWRGAVTNAGG